MNKPEYMKKYRREHREQVRLYSRRYYQTHKEQRKASSRKYRQEHREEVKAQGNRWAEKHREELKEYQRKYYQGHREEMKARHRQLTLEVLTHYSTASYPVCARCGITNINFLVLDHIKGGGRKDNQRRGISGGYNLHYQLKREGYPVGYQVLCANCNMEKLIVEGK